MCCQFQNLRTTGFWPVGSATAGEVRRWSDTVATSSACQAALPLWVLVLVNTQVSEPVAAVCVQPPAPVSKSVLYRMLGVAPVEQSPGPACVLKLNTAESPPTPHTFEGRTRQ